jgi:hypothetical protein
MNTQALAYREATNYIITDCELKPDLLNELAGEDPDARYAAITGLVSVVAPNFVFPDQAVGHGKIAQGLSDWHRDLVEQCSGKYRALTADPDGPQLTKEEANSDSDLQTLKAIRRGVKMARDTYSGLAQTYRSSGRPDLRVIKLPFDFQ